MKLNYHLFVVLPLMAGLMLGCGKAAPDKETDKKKRPDTPVTVIKPQSRTLELYQEGLGTVMAVNSPQVAAEVAGRIIEVLVQEGDQVKKGQILARLDDQDQRLQIDVVRAEERRIKELMQQQQRTIARLEGLGNKFAVQSQLDDARSQKAALQEQLQGLQSQISLAQRNQDKTIVRAPVDGRIQTRNVSPGERINPDKALFSLIGRGDLHVHIPFPEQVANQIRTGQVVRLTSPVAPGQAVEARINEIRPKVDANNRALEAIIDLPAHAVWPAGASVNGKILTGQHLNAIIVPEIAVILRPKGTVVYVVNKNKAQERLVTTGLRQEGVVEIISGLNTTESIALDGAAYLTDGVAVSVKEQAKLESTK